MIIRGVLLFFISIIVFAQQEGERMIIIGDSLKGRTLQGESFREVIGNVIMTQANIRITCRRAIQNITRNEAELIGDVVAVEDSITIKSDRAFYYGSERFTYSDNPVELFDGHITLTAESGYYYFDKDMAIFHDDVKLVDSIKTMYADRLTYFNELNLAEAVGRVNIRDENSSIKADSLLHYRDKDSTAAFGNIVIFDPRNSTVITGGKLNDDGRKKYTFITGAPILTQIDTSETGIIDTLVIFANTMESFSDSVQKFIITDSVKIIRSEFYSVNDYSIYYRDEGKIFTHRINEESDPPVMWYDNSQLIGDSITVYIKENELEKTEIIDRAFILSRSTDFPLRYDQISGRIIIMHFAGRELKLTEVEGNVLSIYFLYEEGDENGVLKSSSEKSKIFFEEREVSDVKLFGSIKSEYYPENLVFGQELDFTLPAFRIFKNKPDKELLFKQVINFKYY